MTAQRWQGVTFGNGWMHRWLVRLMRFIDIRFFYIFSAVFVVPFCVVFCKSRKCARDFYRIHLGYGRWQALKAVYLNFYTFSKVVADKFAMFAGRRYSVDIVGQEEYLVRARAKEGFIQLSSHIGNYEVAGYSLPCVDKPINAVVYAGEKESVMKYRGDMFGRTDVHLIALQDDMSHLFEIDGALAAGQIVSLPADRFTDGSRYIEKEFLGQRAKFPQGPFRVAAMRSLDVLAVNVMKTGTKRYTVCVTPLPYDRALPRPEQMAQLCAAYVGELEKCVRKYPYQWFNFYDFWR